MSKSLLAQLPGKNLQPGELHLARSPMLLQTILGSCVGVTFWSVRLGAGAMCHGVLPRCPSKWAPDATIADGHRYVDFSIRYLLQKFEALGADRAELEIKLFGGADVLPTSENPNAKLTVGAMNCKVALEVLEEEGLKVLASDLRGNRGRRIHFNTATGEVLVHRLSARAGAL